MQKRNPTTWPGAAFVILAALCWGLSGGLGSILMSHGWSPFVVSFVRGATGLAFVLAWLALRPHGSGLANTRLWFWSVIAGMGVAGNFTFYFLSIENGSVAVAATLMYCAPVFVYLISFALKLEGPTALKWTALAVVMLGIGLLTQIYDVGSSSITLVSVGAGLMAGLSYAIFIFGFKYAAPNGSPQATLAIAFTVSSIILIWPGDFDQIVEIMGGRDWPLFLALGVLGAGFSFILYVIGINRTKPAVASVVAMIEPVTASLFSIAFLSERLAGVQFLGMTLILVSVTALSVKSSSGKSSFNKH